MLILASKISHDLSAANCLRCLYIYLFTCPLMDELIPCPISANHSANYL